MADPGFLKVEGMLKQSGDESKEILPKLLTK